MMSVEGLVSDFARLWMRTPDAVICKLIPCLNWRIFIKKIKETNFYIFAYILYFCVHHVLFEMEE